MFVVDPQIERDSHFICDLPLSQLRLVNDNRFPWVLLIPRLANVSEIIDLSEMQSHTLINEIRQTSHALRTACPCNKINVASIGNKVRQLHVHIIARRVDDSAWPGTVWDKGPTVPYDRDSVLQRVSMLRDAIAVLKIN
jgi:diadenosine tetraphosphate (Ap4A) HIT family hydrolase